MIPAEAELGLGSPSAELRRGLQQQAAEAGVFAPHVAEEYGGLGLKLFEQSVVFEAAGYSLLGPLALNCAAPDEGNMHLLSVIATDEQKARYLRPLAAGETRSCFAMTEPAPGAGSDPSALQTTATRVDGGWRIDGRKWLITGAAGAAFAIVMARTGEVTRGQGATMFLVDAGTPGFEVVREIPTLDHAMIGGHCEVVFDDCRVGEDAILGELDLGFRYAQVRLAPARLTHCMRWLGIARRSLDIALEHTRDRELFGQRLHELGLAQQLIADSAIDIEASRGADPPGGARHRRRRPRRPRVVDRQDLRLRGGRPRRRPGDPALRRRRRHARDAAGPLHERGAGVPDLRRIRRDAPLGDRAPRGAPDRRVRR